MATILLEYADVKYAVCQKRGGRPGRLRPPKEHGVDPEHRHRMWRDNARWIVPELDAFIDATIGRPWDTTKEERAEFAQRLEELPEKMTEMEAVFYYDDIVRRIADAAVGRGHAAVAISPQQTMSSSGPGMAPSQDREARQGAVEARPDLRNGG